MRLCSNRSCTGQSSYVFSSPFIGSFVDLSRPYDATSDGIDAPLFPISEDADATPTKTTASSAGSSASAGGSKSDGGKTSSTAATSPGLGPSLSAPSSSKSTSSTGRESKLDYATVIKYHGICAAAAWLVAAPVGVLIARLGRKCMFFPWHWGVQVSCNLSPKLTLRA